MRKVSVPEARSDLATFTVIAQSLCCWTNGPFDVGKTFIIELKQIIQLKTSVFLDSLSWNLSH